jgi:hypothetical protein
MNGAVLTGSPQAQEPRSADGDRKIIKSHHG